MKKVILVTVLFVLATALSAFGVDSAHLTGLPDWTSITNNPAGGGQLRSVKFTSSGTFTVPPGVTLIWVTAWGGGGGGGGGDGIRHISGGGGGGGGALLRYPLTVTPGQILPVTIGEGGSGGAAANGGDGGDTIVGPLVAPGGKGGSSTAGNSYGCGIWGGDGGGHPNSGGVKQHYLVSFSDSISGLQDITPHDGKDAIAGDYYIAGAGGGAGTLGNCSSRPGRGGNFGQFTGGDVISRGKYATGGGGGAGFAGNGGNGGNDNNSPNGQSAAPNSGAGGGGGSEGGNGGSGGSGGAIIEWIE